MTTPERHSRPHQPWRIRRALDHAARQIMNHPQTYDAACNWIPPRNSTRVYEEGETPPSTHCVGSALGWIAHFFDEPAGSSHEKALGHIGLEGDKETFYQRMTEIGPRWQETAHDCAAALMVYYNRYHPDGPPAVSPPLADTPPEFRAGPKPPPT